jgi:hypothetical protein
MIPPALIVVGVAGKPIPLPVLLLWPLLPIALVLATVILPMIRLEGTTARQRAVLPLVAWRLLAAARGLRIDIRCADGTRVYVRCW